MNSELKRKSYLQVKAMLDAGQHVWVTLGKVGTDSERQAVVTSCIPSWGLANLYVRDPHGHVEFIGTWELK